MNKREHFLTNQKLIAALGLEGHHVVRLHIQASVETFPTAVVEIGLPASAQTVLQELVLVPKHKPALDLDAMEREAKARLADWIEDACGCALISLSAKAACHDFAQELVRDMQTRVVGDVGDRAGFFEVASLNDAQPVWVRAQ